MPQARDEKLMELGDQLTMVENILYRVWFHSKQESQVLQLIVPRIYQELLISQCDEGITGGHLGLGKQYIRYNDGHTSMDGATLPSVFVDNVLRLKSAIAES